MKKTTTLVAIVILFVLLLLACTMEPATSELSAISGSDVVKIDLQCPDRSESVCASSEITLIVQNISNDVIFLARPETDVTVTGLITDPGNRAVSTIHTAPEVIPDYIRLAPLESYQVHIRANDLFAIKHKVWLASFDYNVDAYVVYDDSWMNAINDRIKSSQVFTEIGKHTVSLSLKVERGKVVGWRRI